VQFAAEFGVVEDVVFDEIPLLLLTEVLEGGPQHHVILIICALDWHVSQLHGVHLRPLCVELVNGVISLVLGHVDK